jgi:dimethylhistidine N-methyltransferase
VSGGCAAGRSRAPLLHDLHPPADDLCGDALRGLRGPRRTLPPKYFYDRRGAELFERICELEEYYPTRTELGILRGALPEIATRVGPAARVVEFGSGSGIKTRLLLEALESPAAYLPIDISRDQLMGFASSIAQRYPELEVLPVCADYTGYLTLPQGGAGARRTLAFFPGSTIGNLEPREAVAFLRRVATIGGPAARLLIGVDLRKDEAVLERAYNDAEGVTAEFNLNLLQRLNTECGADFDLDAFHHRAVYDPEHGRIEMRLVSRRPQRVRLPAPDAGEVVEISFREGDHITTEHSYKYSPDGFEELAREGGWAAEARWSDRRGWFGVFLLEREDG